MVFNVLISFVFASWFYEIQANSTKLDWMDYLQIEFEKYMQGKSDSIFDLFVDEFQYISQGKQVASNKNEFKLVFNDLKRRVINDAFRVSWDNKASGKYFSSIKYHNFFPLKGCPDEEVKLHGYIVCSINYEQKATHCHAFVDDEEALYTMLRKSDACLQKQDL